MLDINQKWLREHRGSIFKEGIHYHYPYGFNDCRWNVTTMLEWMENSSIQTSELSEQILRTLCA